MNRLPILALLLPLVFPVFSQQNRNINQLVLQNDKIFRIVVFENGEFSTHGKIRFINAADGFYMGRPTNHWKIKAAYGAGAMMDMGVCALHSARYSTGLEPFQAYKGLHGKLPGGKTFDFTEKHQQGHQMDEICRAIMDGRPLLAPGEEGARDMIIVDAIKESI